MPEALGVFLISMGLVIGLGRLGIRCLRKLQCLQPARFEDCPEKLQALQKPKSGTPTMGGVLVVGTVFVSAAVFGLWQQSEVGLVLAVVAVFALIGLWDDVLKHSGENACGLRSRSKFLLTAAAAAAFAWAVVQVVPDVRTIEVPFMQPIVMAPFAWIVFAVVVLSATSHAVNLTDGMDGLAVGSTALVMLFLAAWNLWAGQGSVPLLFWCLAVAGACLGFLWFNAHPAAIFLGDVGALGLGAAIAATALMMGVGLWLVLLGFVFVLEALSVILQVASYKLRGGKRIFRVAPIHHHYHMGGMSEPQVVVRFWLVTVACGLTATFLRVI